MSERASRATRRPSGAAPLDRAAPLDLLRDADAIAAELLRLARHRDKTARRAALEGLVDIEVVGVFLVFAGRDRHAAVDVIGRDPERVVMRVVGGTFRRYRIARRREHRKGIATLPSLRQAQDRRAVPAQRAPVRSCPCALRQRDGILFKHKARCRHGPNTFTGTRLSAGMKVMIASQISSASMNGRQAR